MSSRTPESALRSWPALVLASALTLAACDDGDGSIDDPIRDVDEGVGQTLDMSQPDMALPDMALLDPDMTLPDMALPDPDMALPDMALPDMALPDPDMARPDPDMALLDPDMGLPDMALPDMAPPDMACADADDDQVCDVDDNCPDMANPDQIDTDGDALGDVCDVDDDDDGFDDETEAACLSDGLDAESVPQDGDMDGLCDGRDVCPEIANPDQIDTDIDGIGDRCDICVDLPDPDQADTDFDGLGDACDTCPAVQNIELGPVDFADISPLTLNDNAELLNDAIRLTPRQGHRTGTIFITEPHRFTATTSFSTTFRLRMNPGGGTGADGMTFVVHNDPRGAATVGGGGSSMGYGGIRRSIAVAFDTYDNGGRAGRQNDIRILTNGNEQDELQLAAQVLAAPRLNNNQPVFGWIDYTAADTRLAVYVASDDQKPLAPALEVIVDIHPLLRGDQAWFGFTAATGGFTQLHELQAWRMYRGVGSQLDSDGDGVGDVCEPAN